MGAILLKQAISMGWVTYLQEMSAEAVRRPGPCAEQYGQVNHEKEDECDSGHRASRKNEIDISKFYFSDLELAQRLEPFRNFALNGPCAALAGNLMGSSEVCFFYDQFFEQRFSHSGAILSG